MNSALQAHKNWNLRSQPVGTATAVVTRAMGSLLAVEAAAAAAEKARPQGQTQAIGPWSEAFETWPCSVKTVSRYSRD